MGVLPTRIPILPLESHCTITTLRTRPRIISCKLCLTTYFINFYAEREWFDSMRKVGKSQEPITQGPDAHWEPILEAASLRLIGL